MGETSRTFAPPYGFRDILPTEARELRALERALTETFASYGYVPLEPPMVEYADEPLPVASGRLVQFLDRDGRLVALRPDVTTALARLVAQRYRDATGALRLAYFAPVFREEPAMAGGEREFDQAGVELVGESGLLADAEVLALLAESLSRCGLSDFTIEVGHVGLVRALFASLGSDVVDGVLGALRAGDAVGAFRRAKGAGLDDSALQRARRALAARGPGIEEVDLPAALQLREAIHLARELYPGDPAPTRPPLSDAPPSPATGGGRIGALGQGLGPYAPNVGLVPELPYYTGIVFQVLSPHLGLPIAAGGRYDALLSAFGSPRPATGFAINVARLHRALFHEGWTPPAARTLVSLAPDGDARTTLRLAAALRAVGLAVAIGDPAEAAGQQVVRVAVAGPEHALHDGRRLTVPELARELGA